MSETYAAQVVEVLREHFPELTTQCSPGSSEMSSPASSAAAGIRSSSSWTTPGRRGGDSRLAATTGAASGSPTSP